LASSNADPAEKGFTPGLPARRKSTHEGVAQLAKFNRGKTGIRGELNSRVPKLAELLAF
jgi:hypothetical protein